MAGREFVAQGRRRRLGAHALSSEEIIDRFLQEEDLRIVAGEGEPEEEVVLQPELDDDDEVVTEELAKSISLKAFGTSPWRFIAN